MASASSSPVVSNTTPIINLVGVGLLDLLPALYGAILVPRRVVVEYQVKAAPTDPDLDHLSWLAVVDRVVIDATLPLLPDTGEAAVLSLAATAGARLLLIDEAKARRIALAHGFQVAGSLSIVLRAKNKGLLPAVRPVIDQMRAQGR